jgi:glycosyltransferase involved in cell wall biosynthesis
MRAAVVVTTYNNPRYLGICLRSFTNQTCRDFDVFVADDGSSEETRAKIESLRSGLRFRVEHVWHPDTGYKKSTINNEVFRKLGPEYPVVICVDHDIIAHHRFIEDHLDVHRRQARAVLMGRRVDLGRDVSEGLNEENVVEFNRGLSRELLLSGLRGNSLNWMRAVHIRNGWLQRLLLRDSVRDLLGSNFSVARELLLEVNGYNEDYQAYWGEDGDLFVRLRNVGAHLVGLKGYAIQYHLDHPRLDPSRAHQKRYQELVEDREYRRCKNGIEKVI